jgi:hypothetical protein
LRRAFRYPAGVSRPRSLARFLCRAQQQAEGLSAQEELPHADKRHHTNIWEGEWQDAESGTAMRGFGVELWVMRAGKIAVWEAAFNSGRADQTNSVVDLLR